MISHETLATINAAIAAGDLVIEGYSVQPPPPTPLDLDPPSHYRLPTVDLFPERPHPDTVDVFALRHIRNHGPMTHAWLFRHLDLATDANTVEARECLSRLRKAGVVTVQGDRIEATDPE